MGKFIYQSLMLVAVAFMAISCSTDEIDNYNQEENAIRFPGVSGNDTYYGGYSSADGCYISSYSFMENPTAESLEFQLPVNVIGLTANKERKIGVTLVEEGTTAPEGSYEILGGSVEAGERVGFFSVKIVNTDELRLESASYQIKVKLEETTDFKLGPKEYLTAVLTWNCILPLPPHNNLVRSYNMLIAGEANYISTSRNSYSVSAHLAIIDALGWNNWGDAEARGSYANPDNATYQKYNYLPRYNYIALNNTYIAYAKKLEEYLKAYEVEHGEPLLHDGGQLIGQPVQARQY